MYTSTDKAGYQLDCYDAAPLVAANGDVVIPGKDHGDKIKYKADGAKVTTDAQDRVTQTLNANGVQFDFTYIGNDKKADCINASSPTGEPYTFQSSKIGPAGGYSIINHDGQMTTSASIGAYSASLPEHVESIQADQNGNVFIHQTAYINAPGNFPHQNVVIGGDGVTTRAISTEPISVVPTYLPFDYPRDKVAWQRIGRNGRFLEKATSSDETPLSYKKASQEEGWKLTPPVSIGPTDSYYSRTQTQSPPSFDPDPKQNQQD